MFSFNPLFKNDFFGAGRGHHYGRQHVHGHHHGQPRAATSLQQTQVPATNSTTIQQTLSVAYEKLRITATGNLPAADSGTVTDSKTVAATPEDTDFSPQAVTDRILGFVKNRLETEKANGASDERLQDLYNQALTGIEKGLREAKDIIQANGIFEGEVQENFYATVTKLADGLEALGEALFGTEIDSEPTPVTTPETAAQSVGYQSREVAFQRSRSFEMEVTTQDGDTIKLLVNSGQSGYSNQFALQGDGVTASAFDAGFSSYDNLSFSVEGELDEGEISALKDLFAQVNAVAETFYGGDVELAFDQAMNVGMDTSELSAFAVDINQMQAVAVRDTYVAIDNMAGSNSNRFNDVMPRLGAFAQQTSAARDAVQSLDSGRLDARQLLRDLVSRLHPDAETEQGNGAAFKQFVESLA